MVLSPRWALQDTTTPITLVAGAIGDGQIIQRSGSSLIGVDSFGVTISRLSETTGIDATSTGTTNLYTVPTATTTIITHAVVRCTAANTVTVSATAGIGIAAGEDDIFASETMTGLLTTDDVWLFSAQGLIVKGDAAEIIKLGIDTAATATSQTLAVDLFGYEL